MSSKQDEPVRQAIVRMAIKLRTAGCPVHRVHSDRGRQLVSDRLRTWLTEQAIAFTDTGGEDPQANGRAELSVQYCKTHVRRLLKETQLPTKLWPLLLRQVSERNWREALQSVGVPQIPLLPCGVEVRVRPRSWKSKGPWKDRVVKGRVLCPAPFTSNAYVILLPDNSLLTSSTVVMVPRQLQWVPAPGDPVPPHRRLSRKTKPRLAWVTAQSLLEARGESHESKVTAQCGENIESAQAISSAQAAGVQVQQEVQTAEVRGALDRQACAESQELGNQGGKNSESAQAISSAQAASVQVQQEVQTAEVQGT